MNDEKIAKWKAHVAAAPDDELGRFTLARAYLDAGRLDEARRTFEETIEMKSDWLMAHVLLGRCLVELEESDLARTTLARARELALKQDHEDPLIEIDELMEELDG